MLHAGDTFRVWIGAPTLLHLTRGENFQTRKMLLKGAISQSTWAISQELCWRGIHVTPVPTPAPSPGVQCLWDYPLGPPMAYHLKGHMGKGGLGLWAAAERGKRRVGPGGLLATDFENVVQKGCCCCCPGGLHREGGASLGEKEKGDRSHGYLGQLECCPCLPHPFTSYQLFLCCCVFFPSYLPPWAAPAQLDSGRRSPSPSIDGWYNVCYSSWYVIRLKVNIPLGWSCLWEWCLSGCDRTVRWMMIQWTSYAVGFRVFAFCF